MVSTCEVNQLLIQFASGASTCRHVGIVGPHEFHTLKVHCFQLVEIGMPSVILTQVVVHDLLSQNLAQRCVGRVAGIRNQHLVAWIAESEGDMQDSFLAADERLDFCRWVEVDIVPTFVKL